MPQIDRYKKRDLYIEFNALENFTDFPYHERYTLILITSGSIKGILNERPIAISSPGVLCLAEGDKVQILEKLNVAAQSFRFHPEFLNTITLAETEEHFPIVPRIQTGLSLFQRDLHTGVPRKGISPTRYRTISRKLATVQYNEPPMWKLGPVSLT